MKKLKKISPYYYMPLIIITLMTLTIAESRFTAAAMAASATPQQFEQTNPVESEPNTLTMADEMSDPWYSMPVEKRKLKLMLSAGICIILGFFLMVLMISLIRMGRYYRRLTLSRQKPKPTEYVDAWSRYRLKENWQDDLPDEFGENDAHP